MAATVENATDNLTKFERATEFFEWTPLSFVDDVINAVNDYLYSALDALQQYLIKHAGNVSQKEVEEGVDRIVKILEAAVDKNFDRFELYVLKNLLFVPQGTLLPHEQQVDFSTTTTQQQEVDATLQRLQHDLRSAQYTNQVLRKETEYLEATLARLDAAEQQLSDLAAIIKKYETNTIIESLAHIVDTVNTMKTHALTSTQLLASEPFLQWRQEKREPDAAAAVVTATVDNAHINDFQEVLSVNAD